MDRNNHWCRFPRVKCVCMETTGYERLDENFLDYVSSENKDDASNEKEEEMIFYNDDGSCQSVIIERNLCTNDLCQLLALKNRVSKSVDWCIVEHWADFGLERLLEDHEYVLSANRDMRNYSRHSQFRYLFRKDYRKYEFFHNPHQFFPSDMLDIQHEDSANVLSINDIHLQNLVLQEGKSPAVFSQVWIRDHQKQAWGKAFLLLKDKKLYLSYKVQLLAKFLRSKIKENLISEADFSGLNFYADVTNYKIYTTLNAKNQFRAPTEWGICLRPSGVEIDEEVTPDLKCISCDSERVRSCWLTAMRLAKYGKQLRENYRAFKNKQTESINPKDYNSFTVPNESVRSRVAMDFTGSVGRIVDDPKEAKAIAVAEGYSWKRRWRPTCRPSPNTLIVMQGIESGVHITQPWFHSGMSRDQATALVSKHGTVDGVFLVRESRSNTGAFVLTYKCGGKVLHAQISPILDQIREAHVFSLDSGVTKFYDLLQLVEFYQLNAGCLPTRLTHYVVQNTLVVNNSERSTPTKSGSRAMTTMTSNGGSI